MKKACLVSAGIFVSIACISLGILAILPPRLGIVSKANLDRIEKGMKFSEVTRLLGDSAGFLEDDPTDLPERYCIVWRAADTSHAVITFENCLVSDAEWVGSPETVPDRIWRWLGLDKAATLTTPMPPPNSAEPRAAELIEPRPKN
jgi:hypothetical protein